METHVVIMAGGIGSRFWPMSTPELPKQFIDVLGCGRTLIQLTADRYAPVCLPEHMWVVTSAAYVDIVRQQLPDLPADNILAEPCARNTAPCIAYACWKIRIRHPEANVVVTPADALVLDATEYRRVIWEALSFTARRPAIVTIGITPTRPETGYGYICARKDTIRELDASDAPVPAELLEVAAFKEKPSLEVAQAYLAAGNYFWNAGIFIWNVETIISAIRTYAPQIAAVMDHIAPSFYKAAEETVVRSLFPSCEKISIDYAVMEKADCIYMIPGEFGWSDLGTWGSLHANLGRDEADNAVVGDGVRLYDCQGTVVHVSDLKGAVIAGLDGYIVAEKGGRLLICPLSEEQRIRDFEK